MDAFAWPGVLLLFAVFFVLVFRKHVGRLLDRTKSVSKSGLVAYDEQQPQAALTKPDALAQFLETYHSPLLLETEANIKKEFENRGLINLADANKALVKSLAGLLVEYSFEKTQGKIWASQLAALNLLNGRAPSPASSADLDPFYAKAVADWPKAYYDRSFEEWLEFLTQENLVVVNQHGIILTIRGREFLKWRVENGRTGPHWG